MQIVIDIPENVRSRLFFGLTYQEDIRTVCEAIGNSIPLPKGHGRLIDANELDNDLKERQKSYEHDFSIRQPINEAIEDGIIIARTHVNNAPTIIEADELDKEV